MRKSFSKSAWIVVLLAGAPMSMGARGGCGAVSSTTPAPDVDGRWAITYDDSLEVTVNIGGSTYDATLPAEGGTVEIVHGGVTIPFTLDCSRPEIVCPSEAWPGEVSVEQRDPTYPHRMWVQIPEQVCMGETVAPAENECGAGTLNPDCEDVCDGEITTVQHDRFGVINEPGSRFDLLLGAGIATNGVNCVLLGVSAAHADIESVGEAQTPDWTASQFQNGEVVVGYGGGCLWAGDPDMDGELEALVLGASITFRTGFTGARAE
ncbi:MAG: hypothetical protein H6719_27790 [Sandaracinaceae bacterium]|nr:hypothetical protein [Sandaracinaceae bacterium]